jgi:hypothetical protein
LLATQPTTLKATPLNMNHLITEMLNYLINTSEFSGSKYIDLPTHTLLPTNPG